MTSSLCCNAELELTTPCRKAKLNVTQALYIMLAEWQEFAAPKADLMLRLLNDDLKDNVIHLRAFFCSDKNENLGGD